MADNHLMAPSPWQPLNGQGVRRITRQERSAHRRGEGGEIKVSTVNVGTLLGRGREVVDMLARRRVDVCCIQEVRYKNCGTTTIGTNDQKYKFWYSGNREGTGGVGIFVKQELVDNVIEVIRYTNRMMKIKIVLGKVVYHIVSMYAPQSGCSAQEKEQFWDAFEEEVARVPESEGLIAAGDVNGHIGADRAGYEEIMGQHGFGIQNPEGRNVLDICKNQQLRIMNTYFMKDREKLITYKSGDAQTQIDLILVRKRRELKVNYCKAIPGEACLTQHRLVRADLEIVGVKQKKWKGTKKIKVWKLKDVDTRKKFENEFTSRMRQEENNNDTTTWQKLEKNIVAAGAEVCGVTTGKRGKERETWWWNEIVQQKLREKRMAFKQWQRTWSLEDRQFYKEKCREARREVAVAKRAAWDDWSRDLDTAEGKQKMFRIAKQMKREKKDITGSNYIRDDDGTIKVDEDEVAERWKTYFDHLLNDENENEIEEEPAVEGPIQEVKMDEVIEALKGMKSGKATGPSGVSSDLLKYAGEAGMEVLLEVFRDIEQEERIPEAWQDSYTIPLYKGKGDALQCGKHRGLRMLEHGMKIWERLLYRRLKLLTKIAENQFGFMEGRSTTDAIFIMRQLQEKYGEKKKELYHVFVDLEKAFDKVPRRAISWALRRQFVPERLVRLVMALYTGTTSRVKVAGVTSQSFEIDVGVHQGSSLSPLLFVVVMEEVTKTCRGGVPWDLLYADDLVLTGETKEEVTDLFREWKRNMEEKGMKVSMEKTKMMVTGKKAEGIQAGRYPCGVCGRGVGVNSILCVSCQKWCHKRCSNLRRLIGVRNFRCPTCVGDVAPHVTETIEIEGSVVHEVSQFCYLGDVLDSEGTSERAVRARVSVAWSKWREISGLLVNKSIPLTRRGPVYEACIRPALLYGGETWAMTENVKTILRSCDRKMLRYMAGVTWRDGVSSSEVARRCGLRELEAVLQERRLRWFGHVERRGEDEAVGRIRNLEVPGRRPPGRPRKTWRKNMEEDLTKFNLRREAALDRKEWRTTIARLTS